jgi:hypothetical protein
MTLNLWNPKELEVLEHMCEAYLYGALYSTDFCTLLVWEKTNKDIELCLERHLKMWDEKGRKCDWSYELAAKWMANDLWTLQQKIMECY